MTKCERNNGMIIYVQSPRINPSAVVPKFLRTMEKTKDSRRDEDDDNTEEEDDDEEETVVQQQRNNVPWSSTRHVYHDPIIYARTTGRKSKRQFLEKPKNKKMQQKCRLPPKKKWLQQWTLHLQRQEKHKKTTIVKIPSNE